jgi:hypothetical protein
MYFQILIIGSTDEVALQPRVERRLITPYENRLVKNTSNENIKM